MLLSVVYSPQIYQLAICLHCHTVHLLLVMFEIEYYIPDEGSGPTPSLSDSQRPVILISVVGPHFKVSLLLMVFLNL